MPWAAVGRQTFIMQFQMPSIGPGRGYGSWGWRGLPSLCYSEIIFIH